MSEKKKELKPLKKRQKKFVEKVLETGCWTKAALEAGYSSREYGSILKKNEAVRGAILQALEKRGVTGDLIAERIRSGLDAMKPRRFSPKGAVIEEESPDHIARNLYLDKVLRITGAGAPEHVELDESRYLTIVLTPEILKSLKDVEAIPVEAEIITEEN